MDIQSHRCDSGYTFLQWVLYHLTWVVLKWASLLSPPRLFFVPICFSNSRRVSIKFFKVVGLGLEMVS